MKFLIFGIWKGKGIRQTRYSDAYSLSGQILISLLGLPGYPFLRTIRLDIRYMVQHYRNTDNRSISSFMLSIEENSSLWWDCSLCSCLKDSYTLIYNFLQAPMSLNMSWHGRNFMPSLENEYIHNQYIRLNFVASITSTHFYTRLSGFYNMYLLSKYRYSSALRSGSNFFEIQIRIKIHILKKDQIRIRSEHEEIRNPSCNFILPKLWKSTNIPMILTLKKNRCVILLCRIRIFLVGRIRVGSPRIREPVCKKSNCLPLQKYL